MQRQQAVGVEAASGRWFTLVVLLAGLAIATPACRATENQETALSDGAVASDAAEGADVSISPEASIEPDGKQPPPDVDGSANDATDIPGADGGGSADDATLDVEIADAATESADRTDAGTEDSDAEMPDAAMPDAEMPDAAMPDAAMPDAAMPDTAMPDAAMPDAAMPDAPMPDPDAPKPDGSEPIVPLFPTCAYMPSIGFAPYAIIDALPAWPTGIQTCHCTGNGYALTYRVLCGSYTPPAILDYHVCLGDNRPTGQREIYIVDARFCRYYPDGGTALLLLQHRPLSDWDTLLAEQISGHADSGGHD